MISVEIFSITGDCTGGGLGSVFVQVTGSSPSWTFSESSSTGLLPTSATTYYYEVTNLPSDYYTIQVQDSAGGVIFLPFYISSFLIT